MLKKIVGIAVVGLLAGGTTQTWSAEAQTKPQFTLTKDNIAPTAYTHNNLQVFIIKGKTGLDKKDYLTLSEAMQKDLVKLTETGNVQQLSIQNNSGKYVFIMSGDIVKGGKQDRTIRYDLIIPPHSKNIPIASFCVESGRWSKRSNESCDKFSGSSNFLPSKKSKIAAKYQTDQGRVWGSVSKVQGKLNKNIGKITGKNAEVRDSKSSSSLQLSMENKELKKAMATYTEKLKSAVAEEKNVMGFAYAINGKINTIDVFNSEKLFRKLWPKLLDAAAVEAIAEYDKKKKYEPLSADNLIKVYNNRVNPKIRKMKLNSETEFIIFDSKDLVIFETIDLGKKTWIHQNTITKDPDMNQAPSNDQGSNFNDGSSQQQTIQRPRRVNRNVRRTNNLFDSE